MQSMAHQFLAFCLSKPADETYCYTNPGNCAFAQFLRENGYASDPGCDRRGWQDHAKNEPLCAHPLPFSDSVLSARPRTFGAVADRLEKALATEPAHKAREAGI